MERVISVEEKIRRAEEIYQRRKQMNITEYVKSLLYEYKLNKMKATLLELKHKKYLIEREMKNGKN